MKRFLLAAATVVALASPSFATDAFTNGNKLLSECQDQHRELACVGYVEGVFDTWSVM